MKTLPSAICYLLSALCPLISLPFAVAQPQTAWVARYNGGFSNQTHTSLVLKLDTAGNVYVAGSSQNASNLLDYVVLKYSPGGSVVFAARHSSTNGVNYSARGFALDQNGNAYVTGTGGTVKFNISGAVEWTAPYAGNDVAVDTNGNVYVTGYATNQYATVKLSPTGTNEWVRFYANGEFPTLPLVWPTESQKVAVDTAGRVYVAGWEAWGPTYGHQAQNRDFRPLMLMYDTAGNTVWTNAYTSYNGMGGGLAWGETKGLLPDNQGNVYVTGTDSHGYGDGKATKVNIAGQTVWGNSGPGSPLYSMALDGSGNAYLAGYATLKLRSNEGDTAWLKYEGWLTGHGIALDNVGNVYVTGITNPGAGNDFATLKYDNDGHRQWLIRYNGPAIGNDGATSIAVAPDGSIYVTGYSANASGGSDITTIKYASLTPIQKKSDGSIQLQRFGTPGVNYPFETTTNLIQWTDLGSALADSNGIVRFTDTNAPLFPHRFYRWYVP